jgi:hypothetical protein
VFQTPRTRPLKRSDHVWLRILGSGSKYRCCICGAETDSPPDVPTPEDWVPDYYVPLTDAERDLCPPKN